MGKYGTFFANDLVGEPVGLTYDIVDNKKLKVAPPRTLQEVGMKAGLSELSDFQTYCVIQRIPTLPMNSLTMVKSFNH